MKIIIFILAFTLLLFSKSETPKYQHFYVQIGAFQNKYYAIVIQKKLKRLAYPTQITKRQIGIQYYYKLLIGSYQSREEAEQVKEMLPKEYNKDAFILWDIDT
jgi:cell division protein FtsN